MKENEYKYYIYRLEKISISLKLFHILFLNCFYSNEENNNSINNDKLYNDFFSLKVQTMRKKKLIEWCMQQQNNYLKKNDFYTINKNKRKEILTKQLMSFGQIKTAINTNKNQNLFINSKISNLNENISNNTMAYFLKNQRGKNEINKIFIS
jgi:ATP-dependent Zn protease